MDISGASLAVFKDVNERHRCEARFADIEKDLMALKPEI
jgi:hypothetical protein